MPKRGENHSLTRNAVSKTGSRHWGSARNSEIVFYFAVPLLPATAHFAVSELLAYVLLVLVGLAGLLGRVFKPLIVVPLVLPYMFYVDVGFQMNISAVDAFLPFLFFALLKNVSPRQPRIVLPRLVWHPLVLVFVVIVIFGSASSAVLFSETDFSASRFLLDVFKVFSCLAVYFVFITAFARATSRDRYVFVLAWVGSATAVGSIACIEYLVAPGEVERVSATFKDPNLLGLYLVVSFGLLIMMLDQTRRICLLLPAVLLLAAIMFTGSRGAILSLAVLWTVCLVVVPLRNAADFAIRASSLVLMIAFVYMFRSHIPALERIAVTGFSLESERRFQIWHAAVEVWASSPILGIGLGQFAYNVRNYVNVDTNVVAHNTALSLLAELGLAGFITFSIPLAAVMVSLVRSSGRDVASVYLLAVWGAVLVASMTLNIQYTRFVWVLVSFSVVVSAVASSSSAVRIGGTRQMRLTG